MVFGPFDESRFGFRSITLTLERIPVDCESSLNKIAVTHVVIAAQRAGGIEYWELSERFPQTDFGPCESDTSWSVIDLGGEPPVVGPATPDPTIPIFQVAHNATWPGTGPTTARTSHQLIIDMRTLQRS